MPIPITVPRLGWNMEEGVFLGWLKANGAPVRAGEALFTLESEKATEDIECLDGGILHIPEHSPKKGTVVPVGAVIGFVLQPGEASPDAVTPLPPQSQSEPATVQVEAPAPTAAPRHDRPASSPRARRAAAKLGIDWTQATGTGRSGRIRERDILAITAAPTATGTTRRGIAERMLTSHRSTAPVTLTTTIDATELVLFRNRCKTAASADPVPSYTDLFVKLAALALEKHPVLNARWDNERVVLSASINIGIAVETEAGLLVPVIRDVPRLSLRELTSCTHAAIERARLGKLSARDLRDGTFTVTSLGALGIDAFTPLINYPECAILGIGRIRRCPAVVDEQIAIRDQVTLSLTFDHRITDGAPAARFLQTLSGAVENPHVLVSRAVS